MFLEKSLEEKFIVKTDPTEDITGGGADITLSQAAIISIRWRQCSRPVPVIKTRHPAGQRGGEASQGYEGTEGGRGNGGAVVR